MSAHGGVLAEFQWTPRRASVRYDVMRVALALVLAGVGMGFLPTYATAQSCDLFDDQCIVAGSGICQADGNCTGTPKENGTPCNDGNDCTLSDQCQQGQCRPGSTAPVGSACTSPLGLCIHNASCQFGGFCLSLNPDDIVQCPDSGDQCTPNFCNPLTGQCTSFHITCSDQCSTGQCNPSTGECTNTTAVNEGNPCDDGNECTSNDRCQSGACAGNAGGTPGATVTPKPTAPAEPTPTPAVTPPSGACVGDCDDSGEVTIDELIKGVNIALNNLDLSSCPVFDSNGDGDVTVNELIQGVNAALSGCSAMPTPTGASSIATATPTQLAASTPTSTTGVALPTPTGQAVAATATATATPIGPTSTATPGGAATPTNGASVSSRVAEVIETTTRAFLAIPDLLPEVLGHASGASLITGAPISLPPVSFDCPGGNGGQVSCSQDVIVGFPPSLGPPTYTFTLNQCTVNGVAGATLTFDGTINATGQKNDVCFAGIPSSLTLSIPTFTAGSHSAAGSTTATFTSVSGSISFAGSDADCSYNNVSLQLTGTVGVESTNGDGMSLSSTQVSFSDTSIVISVDHYANQCVPDMYTMVVDGTVAFGGTTPFVATYASYTLQDDASSGADLVQISSGITSGCFGTAVQLSTETAVSFVNGEPCPKMGKVLVSTDASTDAVTYTATGGVEIDLGNNATIDQSFESCVDRHLLECPAGL